MEVLTRAARARAERAARGGRWRAPRWRGARGAVTGRRDALPGGAGRDRGPAGATARPGGHGDVPAGPGAAERADRFSLPSDRSHQPAMGQPPENRAQAVIKTMWVGVWMVYLVSPVADLFDDAHGPLVRVLAVAGMLAFVVGYFVLVFGHTIATVDPRRRLIGWSLAGLVLLAGLLSVGVGAAWLVLFVYVAVAAGGVLPARTSRWVIPADMAVLAGLGLLLDPAREEWPYLLIPGLLGGFAMAGVRQMVHVMRELRQARAAVAHLAANEERLRLARDLHDLLGHSLSLITLKSELAGRMLPADPGAAAEQVSDIERVSRQALVDVREAVSDYRKPTLRVELCGARTAFGAAGIAADLPPAGTFDGLHPDQESALAWALREATTNVVRHSGAGRCTVTLARQADDTLCLTVTDDGRGPEGPYGNGLTGLAERLSLADGRLETGAGVRGGFRLTATVPLTGPRRERRDAVPSSS